MTATSDSESRWDLEAFLGRVSEYAPAEREETIFSLGGRGYYENPASDLLAFFLKPDGAHGLGSLFLEAFSESMGGEIPVDLGATVDVMREIDTGTGGRIDLMLKGNAGVLLIENKIRHHQESNPFDAYEEFGRAQNQGRRPFMAILSPDGSSAHEEWTGVSYQDFCVKLEIALDGVLPAAERSKWWFFAKEFVSHLQNELQPPTMTEEQIKFAEQNALQIQQARELGDAYRQFLLTRLRELLSREFPGHEMTTKDDGWGIRCQSVKWGESDIVWWSKFIDGETKYGLNLYLCEPRPKQLARGEKWLTSGMGMENWTERSGGSDYHGWKSRPKAMSRESSEQELIALARKLETILNE